MNEWMDGWMKSFQQRSKSLSENCKGHVGIKSEGYLGGRGILAPIWPQGHLCPVHRYCWMPRAMPPPSLPPQQPPGWALENQAGVYEFSRGVIRRRALFPPLHSVINHRNAVDIHPKVLPRNEGGRRPPLGSPQSLALGGVAHELAKGPRRLTGPLTSGGGMGGMEGHRKTGRAWVYVCMSICICTCTHSYVHTYIHVYIFKFLSVTILLTNGWIDYHQLQRLDWGRSD